MIVKIKLPFFIILLLSLILVVLVLNNKVSLLIGDYETNTEYLYWLFSASSQSIATFFAFLLAGYTLFVTSIDSLKEKDETLSDIVDEEKRIIYKKIKVLSIVVGFSLVLNLFMIYGNGIDLVFKTDLILITFTSTVLAIILGIWIVTIVINPKKNKIIAEKLLYKDKKFNQKGSKRNEQEFFSNFIELEKSLREYIISRNIIVKSRQPQYPSFKDIITHFYFTKKIDGNKFEELLELNKYRNLLFHGHISEASETMVDKAISFLDFFTNNFE
jgi:hypothetical protein